MTKESVLISRYLEVFLRRVSAGHIVFSPIHKAFVSLSTEGQLPFNAEEYADLMGEISCYIYMCVCVWVGVRLQ